MSESKLCFSSWIKEEKRYASFYKRLKEALHRHGAVYALLKGTRDIWCRDYMPVYGSAGKAVQFYYNPSYLNNDKWRSLPEEYLAYLDLNPIYSKLNFDGGNLLLHNSTAIVSERVYEENPQWSRKEIERELIEKLELERLIIIPSEPKDVDMTGHADGMCRFIDEHHILLGDFTLNENLGERISKILKGYGYEILHLSVNTRYYEESQRDWLPAINYLIWDDVIYLPHLGSRYEDNVIKSIENYFGMVVEPILSNEIVKDGGALNCVSWTMKI